MSETTDNCKAGGRRAPAPGSGQEMKRWCDAIRAHLTAPTDAGYRADAMDALEEMESKLMAPNDAGQWRAATGER